MKVLTGMMILLCFSLSNVQAQEALPEAMVNQEIGGDLPLAAVESVVAEAEALLPPVVAKEELLEPAIIKEEPVKVEPVKEEPVKEEKKVKDAPKKVDVKKTVPANARTIAGTVAFFNARGTMVFINSGSGRIKILISDKTNFFVNQSPAGITSIKIGDKVEIDYIDNGGLATAVNISAI